MTRRDVMGLALKIIGVLCVIDAARRFTGLPLVGLSWTVTGWPQFARFVDLLVGAAHPVLLLVVGYLLVVWSDPLAVRLVCTDSPLPDLSTLTFDRKAFAFSLRIVGAFTLIRALTCAATAVAQVVWLRDFPERSYPWSWPAHAVVYGVIGIYLLTGATHLVNFAYRNRQPEGEGD